MDAKGCLIVKDDAVIRVFVRAFGNKTVIDRGEFNHKLSSLGTELTKFFLQRMKEEGLIVTKRQGGRIYNKQRIL